MLLVSIVPANLPVRASFMAAMVSSFGSEYIAGFCLLFSLLPVRPLTSPHVSGKRSVFLLLLPFFMCIILYRKSNILYRKIQIKRLFNAGTKGVQITKIFSGDKKFQFGVL